MKSSQTLSVAALAAAFWMAVAGMAAEPGPQAKVSEGEAAIRQAAAAHKHLYIFFYIEDNEATRTARQSFEAVMAKMTDLAHWTALKKDAPGAKALVERFELKTLSVPLIVVLAPNGVVTTAGVAANMNEERLRAGIAGPSEQACLKALQDGKSVVLCAYDKNVAADDPTVKAVSELQADAANAKRVEVVRVDPADAAEARFLKRLGVDPQNALTTIVLVPPRVPLAKFSGLVNKVTLERALNPGVG